jgi:hydrogenase expression/formation protein HypD
VGFEMYEEFVRRHRVPVVVTGFEPLDLLEGVLMLLGQLESGRHEVENQYARAVRREGNASAQAAIADVYEVCDRAWRGIGVLPGSGLRLRDAYRDLDAETRFDVSEIHTTEPAECHAGEVLRGLLSPPDCPAFGKSCTPEHPLGAPMVSAEGACAAYHRYGGSS